jgi:hypothetical protein
MQAGISTTVRVLVATLFMTSVAVGSVSSTADAAMLTAPGAQRNSAKRKVVTIAPVKPIPTPPACGGRGEKGNQNYVFNFQTPEHYHYEVKRQTLVSGTSFPADDQTLTITAVPDSGYSFGKETASWEYTLTRPRCGG